MKIILCVYYILKNSKEIFIPNNPKIPQFIQLGYFYFKLNYKRNLAVKDYLKTLIHYWLTRLI